jgi:Tfp pilus assembly protein PilF
MYNKRSLWTLSALLLPALAGCAGQIGQTSGREGTDEEKPLKTAPAPKAADPLAGGAKAAVPSAATKRDISDAQQKEFDEIIGRWEQSRREGSFKRNCSSIASAFGSLANEYPALVEARHNQAAVMYECGQQPEAMKIWEQLANSPKPYAAALAQLGYVALKQGDAARAEALFMRSVEADKQLGSISARLNLAQILRDRARRAPSGEEKTRYYREAVDHLRTVLAVDGNNLPAYAALCYLYYDREPPLYEMAKLVGTQAIWRAEEIATGKYVGQRDDMAEDDRRTGGPARRGPRGRRAAADDDSAAKGRDVAVRGTGYTPEMKKALGMVYNTMGLVSLKRKEVSDAIAYFKKAVDMDPELHEARMNLAALSLNYRNYTTAEENFRAVLTAQPTNYDATIGLGVALRGGKKFDEAEQQYLAAQKLDPQIGDSYFNLGLLYQEYKGIDRTNLQKAQQYYRDYLGRSRTTAKRRDAEKRIKDIDDTIAALEEAAKLQKEAEELQKKMEEQQKKMEEDLKKMQEQEKQQAGQGAPQAAAAPGSSGGAAAPAGDATSPPPTAPPPTSAPPASPPAAGKGQAAPKSQK